MNPGVNSEHGALSYKDAIVCSPHKFIGGPGTVGVLVCKTKLFANEVPSVPGGGTVAYVTEKTHKYTKDLQEREEGGTPAIIESIRTGMVFALKDAITAKRIMERDDALVQRAASRWRTCSNLIVLGGLEAHRLPIFSFCIQHPQSKLLLHHNFVSKLLSDLFGIQSRGGCMCAGPYAEQLMGISEELVLRIGGLVYNEENPNDTKGAEILKPGFCRLNLSYYADDSEIDFIIDAVAMVSEHGWKLLPKYSFGNTTGGWKHQNEREGTGGPLSLKSIDYKSGSISFKKQSSFSIAPTLDEVLQSARCIFENDNNKDFGKIIEEETDYSEEWNTIRWFLLPSEAQSFLDGNHPDSHKMMFMPGTCPMKKPTLSRKISHQVCDCKKEAKPKSTSSKLCTIL